MHPSSDQIAVAAYYRWERRNFAHGRHTHDWTIAEAELTFAANYDLVARYRLDGIGPHQLGDPDDLRCRFCERTAPQAPFEGSRPAAPASLGNQAIFTLEVCDDCQAQYEASVGADLDQFLQSIRDGGTDQGRAFIPLAAFKGLIWAALALLPEAEMQYLEDTVEWVSNPDHDLDSQSIPGVECILHRLPDPLPFSYAALARRSDEDTPHPYLLAFFATGRTVFQFPLPLCTRDEELEGHWRIPRVASPLGVGRSPLDSETILIPLSSSQARQAFRLEFAGF